MGRLVVLVLLVVAAVWLVRRALRAPSRDRRADGALNHPEDLVRCAHCALLLPRAEARAAGDALYCSDEHARLGPGPR